jgi:hypothetical protein
VFLVPNAALRFRPTAEQVAPEFREAYSIPRPRSAAGQAAASGEPAGRDLWLPVGDYVRPLAVRVGLNDGTLTEVAGEQLAEGLAVATALQQLTSDAPDTKNPFAPTFRRGGSSAGGGRPR